MPAQVQGIGGLLGGLQELDDVALLAVLQPGAALLPRAGGQDHMGEALGEELLYVLHLGVELRLYPHGLHEAHVVVDGLAGDAERGDDMAHDAAQGVPALEDGDVHAGAAQEVGGGHAAGAAAHHGHPPARGGGGGAQLGQQGLKPALGGL